MNTQALIDFVRDIYGTTAPIPLHAPTFSGNEKKYVADTIDSTFVSSVGEYVDHFETSIEDYTGCAKAVATVNGTAALHAALYLSGVQAGDLVITQPLTFVATCNAIRYLGADPVFVDVSRTSLGLCPLALAGFLEENATIDDAGVCIHRETGKRIRAVVPMHTFGHPVQLDEILEVCKRWEIRLIEDAAESLGSWYGDHHTGTLGDFGVLSFNGNKVITTGGGGVLLCRDEESGLHAKHVTTTAKRPHKFEYFHDEAGFNYRLPNLNAALGCAQMEQLDGFISNKRELAVRYQEFFDGSDFQFVKEPEYATSNYWLNAVICPHEEARDKLLEETNEAGVMTRPIWTLMHHLPMYKNALRGDLDLSESLESVVVNLPSSPASRVGIKYA